MHPSHHWKAFHKLIAHYLIVSVFLPAPFSPLPPTFFFFLNLLWFIWFSRSYVKDPIWRMTILQRTTLELQKELSVSAAARCSPCRAYRSWQAGSCGSKALFGTGCQRWRQCRDVRCWWSTECSQAFTDGTSARAGPGLRTRTHSQP